MYNKEQQKCGWVYNTHNNYYTSRTSKRTCFLNTAMRERMMGRQRAAGASWALSGASSSASARSPRISRHRGAACTSRSRSNSAQGNLNFENLVLVQTGNLVLDQTALMHVQLQVALTLRSLVC